MKKIHIITKTHLDLGFTDHAIKIERLYYDNFIPTAIKLSDEVNCIGSDSKRFIWTTGSWLIDKALEHSSEENKEKLDKAIKNGEIAYHALPVTTHTELMDSDLLEYAIGIAKKLDKRYNRNTIAAKMTDVPAHTIGMLKKLAENNIKFLHLGVNEASAMPDTDTAFLWVDEHGNELVVLYAKSYGEGYKNPYIDDILYFIHTHDNNGPATVSEINKTYKALKKQYPDYIICASTLDAYAIELLKVKDKLPKLCNEIGDSWIHGVASDTFKLGAFKTLLSLKNKWLNSGELVKNSDIYNNFCGELLLIAEHTYGVDTKIYLADYNHYLKENFNKARKKDSISQLNKKRSYSYIEESWAEQRRYLENAINHLPATLKSEAEEELLKLRPNNTFCKLDYKLINTQLVSGIEIIHIENTDEGVKNDVKDTDATNISSGINTNAKEKTSDINSSKDTDTINKLHGINTNAKEKTSDKDTDAINVSSDINIINATNIIHTHTRKNIDNCGDSLCFKINDLHIKIDKYGAISKLSIKDTLIIDKKCEGGALDFHSYSADDYDYFHNHYNRNMEITKHWSYADFGKPKLHKCDGKYPIGRFSYKAEDYYYTIQDNKLKLIITLVTDKAITQATGAPKVAEIMYTIDIISYSIKTELIWLNKDASRLPEALYLRCYFNASLNNIRVKKIDSYINPSQIVSRGNRKNMIAQHILMDIDNIKVQVTPYQSPLLSLGMGDVLHYDNNFPDINKEGISFILCNNLWGTNFTMWYEENAFTSLDIDFIINN